MKDQIINCSPNAEDIAGKIIDGIDQKVDPVLVARLYSPEHSTDILLESLSDWGML
jgi:hypothetical protein